MLEKTFYSIVITDCGAACLGAICQHYGRALTLNTLREAVGTGQLGTTMLGLRRGATSLGLNARPVRASPNIVDNLKSASLPAIIHWQGHHWVVLHGQRRRKYIIADPAMGIRYISRQELIEGWLDWVMLLLEPDPSRFHDQQEEKTDRGLGRFFQQLWLYRRTLIGALICAQIIGLLSLAYPFLIQILTDDVLIRGDRQLLTGLAIAPNSNTFGRQEHQCSLQLGMESQADIISRKETMLQFILRKARLTSNL